MAITAIELMKKLNQDKEYQEKQQERANKMKLLEIVYEEDEIFLISELKSIGLEVNSVWDLVNRKNDYMEAVPILINHIGVKHHPRILSGIVRSLAIPALKDNQKLWDGLVELFTQTKSDDEISIPENRGLTTSISVALESLANKERVDILKDLVSTNENHDEIIFIQNAIDKYDIP
jgi:hypothetical protein